MCIVSNIGDTYTDKWRPMPWVVPNTGAEPEKPNYEIRLSEITRAEFEALKKDVLEMKKLLKKAIKQDEEEGNADCEMEDKIALLKKVAEAVGVDLSEIFDKK